MLVGGGLLVTGTSISTLFRGIGRGARRVFLGSRDVAQTAIQQRDAWREEKTAETRAGVTDVMAPIPTRSEFEPTVALAEDDDFDYATGAEDRPARPDAKRRTRRLTAKPRPSPTTIAL